jgi:hypothetical protein
MPQLSMSLLPTMWQLMQGGFSKQKTNLISMNSKTLCLRRHEMNQYEAHFRVTELGATFASRRHGRHGVVAVDGRSSRDPGLGCQIFLDTINQNGEKIPNHHKIYQTTTKYTACTYVCT